jgi:ATP-dependent exoDNAse (exonuclease V) beta subunit
MFPRVLGKTWTVVLIDEAQVRDTDSQQAER